MISQVEKEAGLSFNSITGIMIPMRPGIITFSTHKAGIAIKLLILIA
jgi:hypothetical protein